MNENISHIQHRLNIAAQQTLELLIELSGPVSAKYKILLLYIQNGSLEDAAKEFGVTLERARQLKESAVRHMSYDLGCIRREVKRSRMVESVVNPPIPLETPVDVLDLSIRARIALERSGIKTFGELISKSREELISCRNMGKRGLGEIEEMLETKGIILD